MGNPMFKNKVPFVESIQPSEKKKRKITELNPKWSTELDQLLPTALHTPEVGSIW